MKIVVVSDTHKNFHGLKSIVENNLDADMFVHLGDGRYEYQEVSRDILSRFPQKSFPFVRGNCDYGVFDAEEELVLTLPSTLGSDDNTSPAALKMFCVHGHRYNVNAGLEPLVSRAKALGCEIALYGHTHIYKTERVDTVYVMNPGSIDSPRGRHAPSYGIINIDGAGRIEMVIHTFEKIN